MDQGIIQYLKFHYRADFMKKLINEDSSVREFQSNFIIKCAIFSVGKQKDKGIPVTGCEGP
jgi:hypothetical protein